MIYAVIDTNVLVVSFDNEEYRGRYCKGGKAIAGAGIRSFV